MVLKTIQKSCLNSFEKRKISDSVVLKRVETALFYGFSKPNLLYVKEVKHTPKKYYGYLKLFNYHHNTYNVKYLDELSNKIILHQIYKV